MNYNIFIRPLIGAGIGYITNWIAVKMMFRPLHPIKISKFTLPFTPGIIPKNKERLAISIGNSINNNLLASNDLKNALLTEEIKDKIKNEIIKYLNSLSENPSSVKDILITTISEDTYNNCLNHIKSNLTSNIYNTVLEANLGKIISEQIEIAAKEKLKGSMLGILGGNAIVSSFIPEISSKLDEYISNNGQTLIFEMVEKELNKYTSITIADYAQNISNSNINLVDIIMNLYETAIIEKIGILFDNINISNLITEKINAMDVLELEKLILLIMKKELNALINLGAFIGFILGFLNLLF